jgi:hypothetical protein
MCKKPLHCALVTRHHLAEPLTLLTSPQFGSPPMLHLNLPTRRMTHKVNWSALASLGTLSGALFKRSSNVSYTYDSIGLHQTPIYSYCDHGQWLLHYFTSPALFSLCSTHVVLSCAAHCFQSSFTMSINPGVAVPFG